MHWHRVRGAPSYVIHTISIHSFCIADKILLYFYLVLCYTYSMPTGIYKRTLTYKKTVSKIAKKLGYGKWMLGKKHSERTKRKIGLAQKGKVTSEATKRKMSIANSGSKNYNWKGGKAITGGYVLILQPNHPSCNSRGYIRRSHIVMERMLGRHLTPSEIVHHKGTKYPINSIKNKQDDRPQNLQLFPHHPAHTKFHRSISP